MGEWVGYARVSTIDQCFEIQQEALEQAGCKKIFAEQYTGKTTERPQWERCRDYLREGDTLVITKLDRLARSAIDLGRIAEDLQSSDINLRVLDQAIDLATSEGKLLFQMLAAFAEFEMNIRRERQLEGIEAAKAKGVYKGRKPLSQDKIDSVTSLLSQGISKAEIVRRTGVGRSSVFEIAKRQEEAPH